MTFPLPEAWTRNTADIDRDESKRIASPASYLCAQGRALHLAAKYFKDERLVETSRGGVAKKHRHRIHLALFGQLMASFEFMLKDFMAQVIDSVGVFDEMLLKAKWLNATVDRVLSSRLTTMSPGAILVHSSMGWHSPEEVNNRYSAIFQACPIEAIEIPVLEKLWILRHSIAHNAGFVIAHDSVRIGATNLANKVVDIDASFIGESLSTLKPIARRLCNVVGDKILLTWLATIPNADPDFNRDKTIYSKLKQLATYEARRTQKMPELVADMYVADWNRVMAAQQQHEPVT